MAVPAVHQWAPTPSSSPTRVHYWNGSAWQECNVHYWNGSAWQQVTVHYWNGSIWI